MQLTKKDRVVLYYQMRVLEHLDASQADFYRQAQEILQEGYEGEYGKITEIVYDGLNESDCSLVVSILHMFDTLWNNYRNIDDTSDIEEWDVKFRGFDGNHELEGKMMGYVRYLVSDDRFRILTYGNDNSDFNSHTQMLPKYEAMLSEWSRSADKFSLSKEDVVLIVGA